MLINHNPGLGYPRFSQFMRQFIRFFDTGQRSDSYPVKFVFYIVTGIAFTALQYLGYPLPQLLGVDTLRERTDLEIEALR